MLCLQAFLFLIELDPGGFVSDYVYDDLGEGSGASPISSLNDIRCWCNLAVVSRDPTRGNR